MRSFLSLGTVLVLVGCGSSGSTIMDGGTGSDASPIDTGSR
jgi:hypothetical protein